MKAEELRVNRVALSVRAVRINLILIYYRTERNKNMVAYKESIYFKNNKILCLL